MDHLLEAGTSPHLRRRRHLADAGCGGEYQDCCEGGACDRDNLACVTARCVPCGAAYDPACDAPGAPLCNEGLVFRPDGRRCQNPNPPPPPCGNEIELCCPGDLCNSPDLSCGDYGLCEPCGGAYSQPCSDPSVPPCNGPLEVNDYGMCTQDFTTPPGEPCGGEFGVCCAGGTCNAAVAVCVEGRCYACGTLGQPACGAEYADIVEPQCFFFLQPDSELTCVEPPCGGVRELCCDRTGCDDDLVCYDLLCRPCGTPGQVGCDYSGDDFIDEPGVNEPFCFSGLYIDNDVICRRPLPGQPSGECLQGEGEQCEDDLDCVLPESGGGVCVAYEYSACGTEYELCCGRTTCASGLGCNDNSCTPCGAAGFPACTDVGGFQCAPGLIVDEGVCSVPPGPPALPPRPTSEPPAPPPGTLPPPPPKPTRPPEVPPEFGKFPAVRECGVRLGPCCEGGRPSCFEEGLACVGKLCIPCGGRLQRACVDGAGEKSCEEGLEVVSGACVPMEKPFPPVSPGPGKKSGGGGGERGFSASHDDKHE